MMFFGGEDSFLTALQEGRQARMVVADHDDLAVVVDHARYQASRLGIDHIRVFQDGPGLLRVEAREDAPAPQGELPTVAEFAAASGVRKYRVQVVGPGPHVVQHDFGSQVPVLVAAWRVAENLPQVSPPAVVKVLDANAVEVGFFVLSLTEPPKPTVEPGETVMIQVVG